MKKTNSIFLILLLSALVGCSASSNKLRQIDVSMTHNSGLIKLDSILMDNGSTKVFFEIIDGKQFMAFAPGTYNCFFFMDPISKKEYNLLSGEGIYFNELVTGPKKFILTFEKLEEGIKIIHLIGGKEALLGGDNTVGFYDIVLEK